VAPPRAIRRPKSSGAVLEAPALVVGSSISSHVGAMLALLPAWMTGAGRSIPILVANPRLPIGRLAELRTLLDTLMASMIGDRSDRKEPAMGRGRGRQRDLFDEMPQTAELQPELRCKIAALLRVLLTEAAGSTGPNRQLATAGRLVVTRITPDHLARNRQRPHQGRWRFGKTPMQTFLDALPLAKEKLMAT
jgi:hypothetical protein